MQKKVQNHYIPCKSTFELPFNQSERDESLEKNAVGRFLQKNIEKHSGPKFY
jgi:hypothetical protein